MTKAIYQLSLILVFLSGRYYVNTDRIDYIDTERKFIKVGNDSVTSNMAWLRINENDIEIIKKAMGVYK
jgi:hypothetical protein